MRNIFGTIFSPIGNLLHEWQRRRVEAALDEISSVPEGKQLVDIARGKGIVFQPSYLGTASLRYEIQPEEDGGQRFNARWLLFPALATRGTLVGTLIHELRHCQQAMAKLHDLHTGKIISPDSHILTDRVIEADAEATAVDIAWKLKEAGKPRAWKSAIRSKHMMTGPLARQYRDTVDKHPEYVGNGFAKRAVFDGWFRVGSRNGTVPQRYISQGLQYWDFNYAESRAEAGISFTDVPEEALKRIGALSSVNYLDLPGARRLTDEYYSEIVPTRHQERPLMRAQSEYDRLKLKFAAAANDAAPVNVAPHPQPQPQAALAL